MTIDTAPDGRMTGGELQTVREYLGLTGDALAAMLGVNPRTLRAWEAGRDPIPERVREEVEQIEADTAAAVGELVAALEDMRDPAVAVYRTDADMHAARPDATHLTARWWRHVAARAAHEVPGLLIGTADELAGAEALPLDEVIAIAERQWPGARVAVEERSCSRCGRIEDVVVAYVREGSRTEERCLCPSRGGRTTQADRVAPR